MLILTRRIGESPNISGQILVTVAKVKGNQLCLVSKLRAIFQ